MTKISVFGAGSWGTAVARLLALQGHDVCLWGRDGALVAAINADHVNTTYLNRVKLPQTLRATSSWEQAADRASLWVLAVPSFALRSLAQRLSPHCHSSTVALNLAKGLEAQTLNTMSQVLQQTLSTTHIFTLSGPSHAEEVGLDYPTSVVVAGEDVRGAQQLQRVLTSECFRPYVSEDVLGVEYGGAVKNVIALAAGALDGLGFGDNAKGALISRGLAEMVRLGARLGTQRETWFGLSGLGDLVATCTSQHSRNRAVGEQLGRGRSLEQVTGTMTMVAEGVYATQTVYELAQQHAIEMPITQACHAVLYEGASPSDKLSELMTRQLKSENV